MARRVVPRGMARSSILAGWGFPILLLPVILVPPVIMVVWTFNFLWAIAIPAMVVLARRASDGKETNPRLLWLRWTSGSAMAPRQNGVEVIPALNEKPKVKWAMLYD